MFETHHRVRFREVDSYGHMNMAYYLTHYTDHRFEGMRQFIGLSLNEIMQLPIAFHTREVQIEYLLPLLADQKFTIRSHIKELKRSQCYVQFAMVDEDERTVSTAMMRIGCIDRQTGRPTGWPQGLMDRFFK